MADDEENVKEKNMDPQLLAEVQAREKEVNGLINRRDKKGALAAALASPPIAAKDVAIKEQNAAIVERVVAQLQEADLAGIIDGLDQEQSDVFMKYLYRLMSKSSNCNLVLKAHAMLAEKAGMGCVVRVLTDRKTV